MHPIRAACTKRHRFSQKVIRKARLRLQAGLLFPAPCRERGKGRDISFSKRDIPPLNPPRENFTLQASSLKSCNACRIGCLLFFVSKRFGFLLSSLSLCLRLVSLTQSPSTTDFINLACACQSGIASLAAVHTIEQYTSSVAAN